MRNFSRLIFSIMLAAMFLSIPKESPAQDAATNFNGPKTSWHGFDRYDFTMDEQTLAIEPYAAPASEGDGIQGDTPGKRRCIVVVPKQPASGNPWSWRGCYWDHQPQAEIELLKRGFFIAYVAPDPGKPWDAWYSFLTDKHGLSKKPAFVGMSKGGVNAYQWATAHPDEVSCIYADNPGIYRSEERRVGKECLE